MFIVDLLEKLDGKYQLIQSNTDGVIFKLESMQQLDEFYKICSEWEKRTHFKLDYQFYNRIIQSNVNNYILVADDGYLERKGAIVKSLSPLDNDLPIVNRNVNYFVHDIPVEETVMSSNKLIDFQKVTKIGDKYEYLFHEQKNGKDKVSYKVPVYRTRNKVRRLTHYDTEVYIGNKLNESVVRCFASRDNNDGIIYKFHKENQTMEKTPSTPNKDL